MSYYQAQYNTNKSVSLLLPESKAPSKSTYSSNALYKMCKKTGTSVPTVPPVSSLHVPSSHSPAVGVPVAIYMAASRAARRGAL